MDALNLSKPIVDDVRKMRRCPAGFAPGQRSIIQDHNA
jgi:hypothetical protein